MQRSEKSLPGENSKYRVPGRPEFGVLEDQEQNGVGTAH